jgi:hypothetical protein
VPHFAAPFFAKATLGAGTNVSWITSNAAAPIWKGPGERVFLEFYVGE